MILTFDEVDRLNDLLYVSKEEILKFANEKFSEFLNNGNFAKFLNMGLVSPNVCLLYKRLVLNDENKYPIAVIIYSITPCKCINVLAHLTDDGSLNTAFNEMEKEAFSYGLPVIFYAKNEEEFELVMANSNKMLIRNMF